MTKSSRHPSTPHATASSRDWQTCLLILLAGLGLRLWLWHTTAGITMDSPLYVRMGEAFAHGQRSPGLAHPGYSLLLAAAHMFGGGRELPGRIVSLIASLVGVLLTYLLARRTGAAGWAWFAMGLVALHPLLAIYGVAVMTESVFLALVLGALLAFSSDRPALSGGLLGAAWWVRPEAAVLGLVVLPLMRARPEQMIRAFLLMLIVASPSLVFMRWNQGYWSLTPKTALIAAVPADEQAAEWRVTGSANVVTGTTPMSERMAHAIPDLLHQFPVRSVRHARLLLNVWPLPWMALAVAGAGSALAVLWAPLAMVPLFAMLAVPFDVRFHQIAIPSLALFAALGARWSWTRGRVARVAVIALALAGFAQVWAGTAGQRAQWFDDAPLTEMRGVGAWLAEHSDPGDLVMDRKAYVAFFADRGHVQLPDDPLHAIVDYAAREKVRWIVVEEYIAARARPQLRPLLEDPNYTRDHEPRLRFRFGLRSEVRSGVVLFEVLDADSAGSPER